MCVDTYVGILINYREIFLPVKIQKILEGKFWVNFWALHFYDYQ